MEKSEIKNWAIWLGALCLVGGVAWYFSPDQRALRVCENALQGQLQNPSSYSRTSYSVFDGSVAIEYEAENAFKAAVRGRGACSMNAERTAAVWNEY